MAAAGGHLRLINNRFALVLALPELPLEQQEAQQAEKRA
jgi:hypothetical protein